MRGVQRTLKPPSQQKGIRVFVKIEYKSDFFCTLFISGSAREDNVENCGWSDDRKHVEYILDAPHYQLYCAKNISFANQAYSLTYALIFQFSFVSTIFKP